MKKKISPKQKNRLLLAGALLLFWLIYSFAVSNTIELRNECSRLQAQLDSATDAPVRLIQLKTELNELESLTGKNDTSHSLHEQLLGVISKYCDDNNLVIRDFASPVRYQSGEWLIETHPVTVEGAYIPLLKLVHRLEQEQNGKLVSVDFHSKTDNKTQQLSLTVTIYVQNIIRQKT